MTAFLNLIYSSVLTRFKRPLNVQRLVQASLLMAMMLSSVFAPFTFQADATPSLSSDEQRTVNIYRDVSPAVVNIASTTLSLDAFLNVLPKEGQGSGVILTKQGHILTNAHVVADAHQLEVTLINGKSYKAEVVGGDISKDIALIKIDPNGEELPTVQIGNSNDLLVGQKVFAIGNPFGLNSTLTTGVISSLDRTIRARNGHLIEGVIQTDAAINPGNSGGPLLDNKGKLIGINTAIFSPSGASAGIGFAIPASTAQQIANELIRYGKIVRPYIGIQPGIELSPGIAELLKLPTSNGVMIDRVVLASPAHRAGLKGADRQLVVAGKRLLLGGDIIVAYDGVKAVTVNTFIKYIETKNPGDELRLKYYRNGVLNNTVVKLGERSHK